MQSKPTPRRPLDGSVILVVDDEAMILLGIHDHLLSEGAAQVDMSLTHNDAATKCRATRYDLAVLDVRLGQEVTYDLAHDLLGQGCAVVFHSGHMNKEEQQRDFPFARLCAKPCAYGHLVEELVFLKRHAAVPV